nr:unnamed protein product [Spirometra erinaceieuropaei]
MKTDSLFQNQGIFQIDTIADLTGAFRYNTLSAGASAARRYDGASHGQRSCLRGIRSDQQTEVGMRAGTNPLQSYALCHADGRLRDEHPGIRIAYRTDGHLLNQRRMHFQSRVSTTTVHELLFADDCAVNTTSEEDMQRSMDFFSAACENFGLTINTLKTVVMHQPPPNTIHNASQISVNGTQLQVVDNFTDLGSTLSRSTKIGDEVHSLDSSCSPTNHEAEDAQGRHPPDVAVRSRDLDGVHKAGTPTQPLPPQLPPPHTETELERTGIVSIYTMQRQMQLRWSGHLARMDDERPPKRLFYGDIVTAGSRRQGGQICRYKNTLKSCLKRLQINPANWGDLARD